MQKRIGSVLALLTFGMLQALLSQTPSQKINANDRERARVMLADMRDAVKKNYYDPTFHGIDLEARYQTYRERVDKAETLADSYRVIAAFLAGLDDSHTFFIPPRRTYRSEYGYRMRIIGEACFITEVRPEDRKSVV